MELMCEIKPGVKVPVPDPRTLEDIHEIIMNDTNLAHDVLSLVARNNGAWIIDIHKQLGGKRDNIRDTVMRLVGKDLLSYFHPDSKVNSRGVYALPAAKEYGLHPKYRSRNPEAYKLFT